ncbi:DUF5362 family protein [Candidatus Spongiihabitans sp.]|uniref:DUF5362 family protein n=1 Tax=Candidatus Spongiihabitans sp. TaxID=3101308 RepID=UPI003C7EC18C
MMIIMGAMMALSVVGLIIAWLPIWMGVVLFQAAGKADGAYVGEDEELLVASLAKVKLFFIINGVLMLIYVVMMVMMMFGGMASMSMWHM